MLFLSGTKFIGWIYCKLFTQLSTVVVCAICLRLVGPAGSQTYEDVRSIFTETVENGVYHTDIRPLVNQSKAIQISVRFEVVSIVEVNDVTQSFVCNGFMGFFWTDEKLQWNPMMHGGHRVIHPLPQNIWRPRVILMNTLGDRDLFDDAKAPIFVMANGTTFWLPGSLFPVSCQLDLTYYPFDIQTCVIKLLAMSLSVTEIEFLTPTPNVSQSFFTPNGEWEILSATVNIGTVDTGAKLPSIEVSFVLKRRPFFVLMNILLPVVFLSFLNLLVFVIPVDSGEKIGYGITVLLALTVFMSIISSMLPRSSLSTPNLTTYIFILLIISMLTVIDSIIIVYIFNMEEKEKVQKRAQNNFQQAFKKVNVLRRAISPMENHTSTNHTTNHTTNHMNGSRQSLQSISSFALTKQPRTDEQDDESQGSMGRETEPSVNKYKVVGKHIDKISFIAFSVIWISVTLGFIISMALNE
ncbi:neuronal acetylcholine receptor subunit beta-4-like [Physella acuta]|uniref:neuronal acetylcholine receptor subunit beta-4-like n=1 Tax=Physella acuta TaxID=109671 RepID=UPI0027DD614D|nr:neuronal acetylcholine receptor subunit beta-4-like [Physella acuta]